MANTKVLSPHPPEFDLFLYASVGEDRNGFAVTVLSALARLGLDPWKETAELVAMGRDAARARLGARLARVRDIPALANDHGRIARDLSLLLPERPTSGALQRAASSVADGYPITIGAIFSGLAIFFVLFQMFMALSWGSGE
ncbi:MAG: hypothetical protein CMH12_10585 [Maritimibacter sp.]|nr:hypothetical protein [Maritimibacter sp.]